MGFVPFIRFRSSFRYMALRCSPVIRGHTQSLGVAICKASASRSGKYEQNGVNAQIASTSSPSTCPHKTTPNQANLVRMWGWVVVQRLWADSSQAMAGGHMVLYNWTTGGILFPCLDVNALSNPEGGRPQPVTCTLCDFPSQTYLLKY